MAARIKSVRSFTGTEHTNEHSTTRESSSILGRPAMSTIFDKILDGEIPCHKVYEDEHVLAFLDIGPLALGHTLVIPKERKAYLHELSDDAVAAAVAFMVWASGGAAEAEAFVTETQLKEPTDE